MKDEGSGLPKMPKRPREHQVEDEARLQFHAALPTAWVVRSLENDYGIDDQVEIFDNNGLATGRMFLTQNKATDEPNLSAALAVRLRAETAAYLAEQDLPVLVVRYHAPTKTLYVKWFHAFDIRGHPPDQKTITYRLSEADKWSDDTPRQLAAEVERWRRLRLRQVRFPLTLALDVTSDIGAIRSIDAEVVLKAEARALGDLISIQTREAGPDDIAVVVDQEVIHINRGSRPTMSVHHPNLEYGADDLERFAADFFAALGCWFGQIGEFGAATRLISAYGRESWLLFDPNLALRALSFYVRGNEIEELLSLIDHVRHLEPDESVTGDLLHAALLFVKPLGPADVERIKEWLAGQAQEADSAGDVRAARVAYYNVGSFLRGNERDAEAIAYYTKAAEIDPAYYPTRPYYCRELGGIHFRLGQYQEAADLYQKALEADFNPLAAALLGDALMFAGRYDKARKAFDDYLTTHQDVTISEFVLKWFVLEKVIETVGTTQKRSRDEAEAIVAALPPDAQLEDAESALRSALTIDGLSPSAAFGLGVCAVRRDQIIDARDWFLLSALCNPSDAAAWANALHLAFTRGSDTDEDRAEEDDGVSLAQLIFDAVNTSGTDFIQELRVMWSGDSKLLEALASLIETIPPRAATAPTIRLVGDAAEYETLDQFLSDDDDLSEP